MRPAVLFAALLICPASFAATTTDWVARSNEHAQVLLEAQAAFAPERASAIGLPGHDEQVVDLGPHNSERFHAAYARARSQLQAALAKETDPNVREDLQILIDAATRAMDRNALDERLLLDWTDVPELVFGGERTLLQEQSPPEKRAHALARLRRYLGMEPGSTSVFAEAKARFNDSLADAHRIGPYKGELDQALANTQTYVTGVHQLFAQFKIAGAEAALAEFDKQVADYAAWERATVVPKARADFRLPPELYAMQLRNVGIDIDPLQLVQRAQLEFMETRAQMQQLAPIVAKEHGLSATGYLDVIRALKKDQLGRDQVEPYYRDVVIPALEKAIVDHRVASLPNRPMIMRIASDAETAQQPAPHMQPPPLIGNHGERGQFVLTTGNPDASGKTESFDDFTYKAAAWTLTAHEGRPGHELQFSAMVEHGVSLARSLFAFNSVNVEGWALYSEMEMLPYEPHDGQLIALQLRLLRAARAMLDPMLNLGLLDRDTAFRVLTEEVGLSHPFAQQEVDRYMFRMPGQAGSYFYGYSRIMALRAETEVTLGAKFDRFAFNNFLIDQGLLPPDLIAKAVREQFVPAQRAKKD
ncbi:MAG TPA: DUF885 domain-containing protein [Xanthomonadaceae bacterium]|jgi:uncharacterized protein (DUF885 family)